PSLDLQQTHGVRNYGVADLRNLGFGGGGWDWKKAVNNLHGRGVKANFERTICPNALEDVLKIPLDYGGGPPASGWPLSASIESTVALSSSSAMGFAKKGR